MVLLSACRLINTEMLQNQKLVSALNRGVLPMGHYRGYTEFFSCSWEVFYVSARENFMRKIPADDIVLHLKKFFIHKTIFQRYIQSYKKCSSFINKTIYESACPFICSRYKKVNPNQKKKSLRHLRNDRKKWSKGNQNKQQ